MKVTSHDITFKAATSRTFEFEPDEAPAIEGDRIAGSRPVKVREERLLKATMVWNWIAGEWTLSVWGSPEITFQQRLASGEWSKPRQGGAHRIPRALLDTFREHGPTTRIALEVIP